MSARTMTNGTLRERCFVTLVTTSNERDCRNVEECSSAQGLLTTDEIVCVLVSARRACQRGYWLEDEANGRRWQLDKIKLGIAATTCPQR
jgi:hypothetical protein